MRPFAFAAALLAFSLGSAWAQQVTTTDNLGQTVVELITVDPALGVPVTETLQTLTTAATTTTTQPQGQQGPVGQPAATSNNAGPTVYTYTTTDAAGDFTAIVDTFTPTFVTTSTWVSAPAGTIIPYSSWINEVGTNTVAASISAAPAKWSFQTKWMGIATGVFAGVAGGAWLVLA
ncbi:hypothetical protein C8Q79DRAFT_947609 [Trametes meyenii]|nr:hypothetical protein C8Q79DRAFT_947609 [Trametes meyenii]